MKLTVERLAFGALLLLALGFGLGDIAQVTTLNIVVLNGVRGLLPLAIGLTVLAAAVARRWPAFPRQVRPPMVAWLLVLVLSGALAPTNRSDALAALERPFSGALLAWSTCALCTTRHRWLLLARALALGGLAIAVIGLAEASGSPSIRDWLGSLQEGRVPIGDVPRIASTLSHPNLAAILLELSLPLLVAWTWTAARPWGALVAVGALSNLLAMVLTFSRAGIVAGLAGLAVMAGSSVARGERRRLVTLGLASLAVPAALICAAMIDPGLDRRLTAELTAVSPQPPLSNSPPGLSNTQPTRAEYWSVAWAMLRDHPWLGVGPDNYRWRFASYSGRPADNLGIHAHDQYIEALADTGVLGLLTLGWLLAALFRAAIEGVRSRPVSAVVEDWPWRAAVLASLSAWLLHAVLDDFERFWPTSVAFWLIAGLTLRLPVKAQQVGNPQRLKSQKTAPTMTISTSRTRIPLGLASAAPPPPPPLKLTMLEIVRRHVTSNQAAILSRRSRGSR
jgi:O-antigen ligase